LSAWDEFTKYLRGLAAVPAAAAGALGTGLVQGKLAETGVSPELGLQAGEEVLPEFQSYTVDDTVEKGAERINQVMTPVNTTLDKYVYQPTYRVATTAALVGNEDTYNQGKNPLDALKNAWNASADISLGQAVADNVANYANILPDWGALAELNKVDIDIYNKEQREKVYLRTYDENGNRIDSQGNKIEGSSWIENVFRNMSGTIDFAKVILLDPFIVAGKGLKLARLSKLDNFRPESIIKDPEWNAQQSAYGKALADGNKEKLALIDEVPNLTRAQTVMTEIVDGNLYGQALVREVNSIRGAAGKELLDPTVGEKVAAAEHLKFTNELKATVQARQARIEEIASMDAPKPVLATGVKDFVKQIVTLQMTGQEISRHRLLQDYATDIPFLADTLAEAGKRGEGAVADVLAIAGYGDPAALIRLKAQHEELLTMIDFQQGRLDRMEIEVQQALNVGDSLTVERINNKKKEISKFLKAVIADDKYLQRITRNEDNITSTLPGVPVSNSKTLSPFIEKYRANKAIVRAGIQEGTIQPFRYGKYFKASDQFDWTRVSKSPLHGVTYVAQWSGYRLGLEKPRGLITTRGLDAAEGVTDLQLILNDTNYIKDDIQLKRVLLEEFTQATDSIQKTAVIEKVELAVMDKIFTRYGVDGTRILKDRNGRPILDADGKEINLRDAIYNEFNKKRTKDMLDYMEDGAFSIDSNGTKIINPVHMSELAYSHPIMPFEEFEDYVQTYLGTRNKVQAFVNSIEQVRGEILLPAFAKIDTFWRAEVLLRVGYPIRNGLTTGTILSMHDVGLSGMYSMGSAATGTSRFFNNRWTHMLDVRDRLQFEIDRIELDSPSIQSSAEDLNDSLMKKASGLIPAKIKALRQFTPFSGTWSDYELFHSSYIQKLKDERDGIIEFGKEILENPDLADSVTLLELKAPTETVARLNAQIALEEQKLLQIARRMEIKGERFGLRNIVGQQKVVVGPYEFAGVYAGSQGAATRKLTSAGGTAVFDVSPLESAWKEMGIEGTGKFNDVAPSDDLYFFHLSKIINQQLRGSKPVMMLLNGKSDDEVLAFLTSKEGRDDLKTLNWTYDVMPSKSNASATRIAGQPPEGMVPVENLTPELTAKNYLHFIKTQVLDRLLPTDEMKTYVSSKLKMDEAGRYLSGDVTSAELRVVAGDAELNPIAGEVLKSGKILGNPDLGFFQKLDKVVFDVIIRRAFKALSEGPEDAALTHPFGNAVYVAKLDEIVQTWTANGLKIGNKEILEAESAARKWAIQETKKWMYRVTRKNGIAASIPLVAPFINAQMATFKQVGRLSYRNPDKAARVAWLWNQINTNSYEDEEGQRFYVFRIPKDFYDDKGMSKHVPEGLRNAIGSQNEWKWSTPGFNLLLAGLRIPTAETLPGVDETLENKVGRWAQTTASVVGIGPFVQIAANEIIKNDPSIDQTIYEATGVPFPAREFLDAFASPFPTGNPLDPLLSASAKRIISLIAAGTGLGEYNNDWQRTKLLMFQNHIDRQSTGQEEVYGKTPKENYEELWDKAGREATWHTFLRLANNLGLPFIPSYEGRLTNATGLYRAYQTKYGITAYEEWIKDYPDLAYIAVSRSKNPSGSSQSTDAVALRKQHNDMIEEALDSIGLPRELSLPFVQMVTNKDVGVEILRDPRAGYWQRNKGDREQLTAEEGWENSKIREGWAWYMKQQDLYDEGRAKLGGISKYSAAAEGANEDMRNRIQRYKLQNEEWYENYAVSQGKEATVGFVKAITVALNNEKFTDTLPANSFWWDLKEIIVIRQELVEEIQQSGRSTPDRYNLELLEKRVEPYLQNPTTKFYWEKFFNNDNFLNAEME